MKEVHGGEYLEYIYIKYLQVNSCTNNIDFQTIFKGGGVAGERKERKVNYFNLFNNKKCEDRTPPACRGRSRILINPQNP